MSPYTVFPAWKGATMPKSRLITRANKKREQMISAKNAYGMSDPTPYEAVKLIRQKEKAKARAAAHGV